MALVAGLSIDKHRLGTWKPDLARWFWLEGRPVVRSRGPFPSRPLLWALEASLRRCRAGACANCLLWHSALHTLAALILVTCSSASHATRISGCFNSSALRARLHPFIHFANGDCCSTKAGARCTDVCRPRPVTRPKNKVYGLTSLMCLAEASDRHVLQLVYHCGQQVQSSGDIT